MTILNSSKRNDNSILGNVVAAINQNLKEQNKNNKLLSISKQSI